MDKSRLILTIESERAWSTAKHKSADLLLEHFDNTEIREYIWSRFIKTKDYYYCSILKTNKNGK
tara:strand:+ start:171 stop:362 length:192 start_codon:yes stop_codon:yes gene_type:complete